MKTNPENSLEALELSLPELENGKIMMMTKD